MPNQPINRPLPPSVEQAYRRKCSELKRRIAEVEETNDTLRLRKSRMNRAILKMRLERAFLLEQLTKRMEEKLDESDKSTSPPPTVCRLPHPLSPFPLSPRITHHFSPNYPVFFPQHSLPSPSPPFRIHHPSHPLPQKRSAHQLQAANRHQHHNL
ncbi:hypothetical protein M501DRAFT_996533 [Patellaria atrata CBS 101060]|uniref:INO80 complex subunit F domain-containing protein n=1 Tax=Patellaria atrata CBS 101060 TaxID=1346257 RepID=A0A9P4S656_9PEZI|nr:hypothetical protein M501DRAFT_996533 [Patellaria atrata CBS 101060]